MNTDSICNLPIKEMAKDNSILLMWVTYPMLPEGLKVIEAWGFEFKTCAFTWVKQNKNNTFFLGMGRYTRANPEICLLAKRGKGLERKCASVPNLQMFKRGEHSKKPIQIVKEIEKLFGTDIKRIELFSRLERKGWDYWGNEIQKILV